MKTKGKLNRRDKIKRHTEALQCGTPPTTSLLFRTKPKPVTPKPRETQRPPLIDNVPPEPQALTESNLSLHNGMLEPQQPSRDHNNASGYSLTEIVSSIWSYTMAGSSSAYASSDGDLDTTNHPKPAKPRETQGPLADKEQRKSCI